MHALVGQWAKLRAQRGNHPTRQIDVAAISGLLVLLNAHHDLLRHKAMPAAKGLGVFTRVRIVGGHIPAHDVGGVLSNF